MINRINDFNCFDDNTFLKLDIILNKKVEAKYQDIKEAQLHNSINKDTKIEETINGYSIVNKDKMNLEDALSSGMFKKIAWGEYLYSNFTGRNDSFPEKYSFDDGSIWKVEKGEDGKDYLVKEVDDNDNLLRTAGQGKNIYVSKANAEEVINVFKVFKDKDDILNYILNDKNVSKYVFEMLSSKLEEYVKEYLTKNKYTESKDLLDDILTLISRMLKSNDIKSLNDLDNVIKTICDKTTTIESDYSFFKERK